MPSARADEFRRAANKLGFSESTADWEPRAVDPCRWARNDQSRFTVAGRSGLRSSNEFWSSSALAKRSSGNFDSREKAEGGRQKTDGGSVGMEQRLSFQDPQMENVPGGPLFCLLSSVFCLLLSVFCFLLAALDPLV